MSQELHIFSLNTKDNKNIRAVQPDETIKSEKMSLTQRETWVSRLTLIYLPSKRTVTLAENHEQSGVGFPEKGNGKADQHEMVHISCGPVSYILRLPMCKGNSTREDQKDFLLLPLLLLHFKAREGHTRP